MGEKQGEGRDRGINLFFTDSFQQEGQTLSLQQWCYQREKIG